MKGRVPTPSITEEAAMTAKKVAMRKMNIFFDRWYMACNRMITMAYMIFQSSQYY